MTRVSIGDGRWFDTDKAKSFSEDTRWDGNNHISCATGSQWAHETLWRTAGGTWIVESTSQWQGARGGWEVVTEEIACRWLVKNAKEELAQKYFSSRFQALEL